MVTSMNLLTLEVYYRYTPHFAKAKPTAARWSARSATAKRSGED
jgi:hypothetical protein